MTTFAERLKHVRERLGLTKVEMAKRLGVSHSHLSHLESAHTAPSDLFVKAVCREFFISEEWLRDGIGSETQPAEAFIKKQMEVYGPEVLAEAFLAQTGNTKASGSLPILWPLNEPIPIDAADLRRMVDYLISLWLDGDPRRRNWAAIQFEQAFPEFREETQKKQRAAASEGTATRPAANS